MPLSDARETGANALIPRVAGGRRAFETTQCARHHSAAPPLGIGRAIGTVPSIGLGQRVLEVLRGMTPEVPAALDLRRDRAAFEE